jgi:RNA polymerase sigma-70 factor (ECF subfamily)
MSVDKQKHENGAGEDVRLIEEFLAGENSSFDRLVLKYKDRVLNICYRMLGDYDEAVDMSQETFIKVYRSIAKFRFDAAFSTWLYRVAVNNCKNKLSSLRYRLNRRMVRLDGNPERGQEGRKVRAVTGSPETELVRKENELMIQKAIDALPEDQKTVVVLRDIQRLSYEEIIEITGFNSGTMRSKLARAREKLRKELKELL